MLFVLDIMQATFVTVHIVHRQVMESRQKKIDGDSTSLLKLTGSSAPLLTLMMAGYNSIHCMQYGVVYTVYYGKYSMAFLYMEKKTTSMR